MCTHGRFGVNGSYATEQATHQIGKRNCNILGLFCGNTTSKVLDRLPWLQMAVPKLSQAFFNFNVIKKISFFSQNVH
jgi:hypothetical protein